MIKSKKKLLAIMLIISLLISFVPNLTLKSIADETPNVKIHLADSTATTIEAAKDDVFSVNFELENGYTENVSSLNLTVSYDSSKIKPIGDKEIQGQMGWSKRDLGVTNRNAIASTVYAFNLTDKSKVNFISLDINDEPEINSEGSFGTIQFQVLEAGESSITIDELSFVDTNNPDTETNTRVVHPNSTFTITKAAVPATIAIDQSTATIRSTDTLTLTATITGSTTDTVVWTVSPSTSADFSSIETNGSTDGITSVAEIVPLISEGSFTVRATLGDKYKECTVNVSNYVPLTGITLSNSSLTLNTGEQKTLSVTNVPLGTTDSVTYEWTCGSDKVSLSSTTGSSITVTGVDNGNAEVTVRPIVEGVNTENMTKTCSISVHTPVTELRLDDDQTIDIENTSDWTNKTLQLHAAKLPDGTSGPVTDDQNTIKWSSSDTSVAVVDENGLVTPVGKGTATITASVNNTTISDTCEVTVRVHVFGIEIENDNIEVQSNEKRLNVLKGQSANLSVVFTPDESELSDDVNKTIEWNVATDDAEYVSVSNGTVTAHKGGRDVRIAATIPGTDLEDFVIVHVEEVKADTLAFNKTTTSISMDKDTIGKTNEETLYVYLLNSTDDREITDEIESSKVTVTSNNTNVSVSKANAVSTIDGKKAVEITVSAGGPCEATITASYDGLTTDPATLSVSVTRELDSIDIVNRSNSQSIEDDIEIELDESPELAITIDPEDATIGDAQVEWTSSDEDVATVDNTGKVTPLKGGNTTITAKLLDKSDSVTVVVKVLTDTVEIKNEDLNVYKGRTLKLNTETSSSEFPNTTPTDEPTKIEWESDNESIATVSEDGIVTGVGSDGQTATITVKYTYPGDRIVSNTATVTVREVKANSVTVVEKPETIYVGQDNNVTVEIGVTGDEDTTDPTNVTVEDENGNALDKDGNVYKDPDTGEELFEVEVSDDGKKLTINGKKPGKYTVKVNVSGKEDSFEVTVDENPIESITAKPKSAKISEGSTTTIDVTYKAKDPNADTTDPTEYTYESSDKSVATVDANGKIKGLKKGKAIITVSTTKGIKDTFEINIEETTQQLSGGSGDSGNSGGSASATNSSSPHTGDLDVARYVIMSLVSLAGMIIAIKKR